MTIYLVRYSTGSWDDYSLHIHSAWDSEDIAKSICEKINTEIENWKSESEPKDDESEEGAMAWLNWHKKGNFNKAWVEPILVNNILPDQETEFNLQSITNK